jgi:hypothetical protein
MVGPVTVWLRGVKFGVKPEVCSLLPSLVNASKLPPAELSQTPEVALTKIPYEKLCPGSAALDALQEEFR